MRRSEDRHQEGHDVGIQWSRARCPPGAWSATSELTGPAVAALSPLVRTLPFEALTPVKQLLKRYFSDQPWTAAEDDALAELVGAPAPAGPVTGRVELAPELGARLGLARRRVPAPADRRERGDRWVTISARSSAASWCRRRRRARAPSASPRRRSVTGRAGPSRGTTSATRAARPVFDVSDDVTNVLVGPDFVAVTITRADQWEHAARAAARRGDRRLRRHGPAPPPVVDRSGRPAPGPGRAESPTTQPRRLERAWSELGAERRRRRSRRPHRRRDARRREPERRQVAAVLLADVDPDVARRPLDAPADRPEPIGAARRRSTRSATHDREELRPLLETALDDTDAWTRWHALRGIAATRGRREPDRGAGPGLRPGLPGAARGRPHGRRLSGVRHGYIRRAAHLGASMFITMPQLGETVTEGTIVRWCKAVGDEVAEDEPLFEVSTDKVDTEVPSAVTGVLSEILVAEGDTASVGARLAVVRTDGDAAGAGPTRRRARRAGRAPGRRPAASVAADVRRPTRRTAARCAAVAPGAQRHPRRRRRPHRGAGRDRWPARRRPVTARRSGRTSASRSPRADDRARAVLVGPPRAPAPTCAARSRPPRTRSS